MSESLVITDRLQEAYDYSAYTIMRDIVLLLVVYTTYTYLPFNTFSNIWKIYIGLIMLRFVLSELTAIRKKDSNKKYFQLSGHMALFTLSLLFATQHNVFNLQNPLFRNALLLIYGLLNIIVHAHYTTDIINTTILIHFIYFQYQSNSLVIQVY